jgi:2-oxoglutarate dehydrogenase E2 component (dihydrolipoamide succinyltransferase)
LICKIEIMEGGASTAPVAKTTEASATAGDKSYASGHPSPAAGKILDEKGISASQVSGTGVGGRITKEDAAKAQQTSSKAEAPKTAASAPVITSGGGRNKRSERCRHFARP